MIFTHNHEQLRIAQLSKAALIEAYPKQTVVTEIEMAGAFYKAAAEHQHRYQKRQAAERAGRGDRAER